MHINMYNYDHEMVDIVKSRDESDLVSIESFYAFGLQLYCC